MDSNLIISLLTLTAMEIVLGIDNVIFISILAGRLEAEERKKARQLGLLLALLMRVGLLFTVSWLVHFTQPIFTLFSIGISVKDLILLGGGLFLIYKSTTEIYHKVEQVDETQKDTLKRLTLSQAIVQIIILDVVFSLDSIITAVGLVDSVYIMIAAVVISMVVMLLFARAIGDFVQQNPSIKILALAFLIMIGTMLTAEAFHVHFPKGYIYFAMAFSLSIELLNMRYRKKIDAKTQEQSK